MASIRDEAKRNSELITDLDNFRNRYIEYSSVDPDLNVTFPANEIEAYEKNLFILLSRSKKVEFKPEWYQRPDYVSKEYYRTNIFWALILFVNRIPCIEDFKNLTEILVPPYSLVLDILKDRVKDGPINLEEEVNYSEARYFKSFPLDTKELETIAALERLT